MSSKTVSDMLDAVRYQADSLASLARDTAEAIDALSHLTLSDSCRCNPSSRSWWIHTKDRSDIVQLMTLAPKGKVWRKEVSGAQITYFVQLDSGVSITLYAADDALPPTCQVIEVDEEVPATTRKVRKIVCNQGDDDADAGLAALALGLTATSTI